MVSEKSWSIDAVARLFLGVIMSFCLGILAAGILQALKLGLADDQLQFLQMIVVVIFFQGAALIWIALFLRQSNLTWRAAFGLNPPSRVAAIGLGLATGILVLPFMWFLQAASQKFMVLVHLEPVAQAAVAELQNNHLSAVEKIVFGVCTVLLAPVAEEALFRGIMYPTIKQAGYPRVALWATSVIFGVMHGNMAALVPLILLALLLVYLYESTGSLLTCIATHCTFNGANFLYIIFMDPINRALDPVLHRLHLS